MKVHPQREAAPSRDAAWWLVPVAFAAAALAAVAFGDADKVQSHAATVQPVKANSADVKPASINPPAAAQPRQPDEPVYEVEHVQAF